MAKTPTATGARAADPKATPNPSASDRAGNDGPGTDLPASTPVDGGEGSGAAPEADVIKPEPFSPNFDDKNGDNTSSANAPGLADDDDTIELETTGEFMVQDPYTLDLVGHEGTHKVRHTSYIQTKIDEGLLRAPAGN